MNALWIMNGVNGSGNVLEVGEYSINFCVEGVAYRGKLRVQTLTVEVSNVALHGVVRLIRHD